MAPVQCPFCGKTVDSSSPTCTSCGVPLGPTPAQSMGAAPQQQQNSYAPPAGGYQQPGAVQYDYSAVAKGQRLLAMAMIAIIVYIVLYFIVMVAIVGAAASSLPQLENAQTPEQQQQAIAQVAPFAGIASTVLNIIALITIVFTIYAVVSATSAMRQGSGLTILFVILSCCPCLGLIITIVLNNQAAGILKSAGYQVGFFGTKV